MEKQRMALVDAQPSGYDMNRCYPTSNFTVFKRKTNYTGKKPSLPCEVSYLTTFLSHIKKQKKGSFVLLDVHGWLDKTLGSHAIGKYYNTVFKNEHTQEYGPRFPDYMGERKIKS